MKKKTVQAVDLQEKQLKDVAGGAESEVPMELKADDNVLISKYSGTEVKIEGEENTILRQSQATNPERSLSHEV